MTLVLNPHYINETQPVCVRKWAFLLGLAETSCIACVTKSVNETVEAWSINRSRQAVSKVAAMLCSCTASQYIAVPCLKLRDLLTLTPAGFQTWICIDESHREYLARFRIHVSFMLSFLSCVIAKNCASATSYWTINIYITINICYRLLNNQHYLTLIKGIQTEINRAALSLVSYPTLRVWEINEFLIIEFSSRMNKIKIPGALM